MEDFFDWLYEYTNEGEIEIRALPGLVEGIMRQFFRPDELKRMRVFLDTCSEHNIFFTVATRRNGGGTKEDIVQIPAVWVDIDYKDTPQEVAMEKVGRLMFQPSAMVESGAGLHLYWKLYEPMLNKDIAKVEYINRKLAEVIGGDTQACDASRILRVPTTMNHKYQPSRKCRVMEMNDIYYSFEQFTDLFGSKPEREEPERATGTKPQNLLFSKGNRDNALFHVANMLVKGGMEENNVRETLMLLGESCDPPFPKGEVSKKVESAIKRAGTKEGALSQEIRDWVSENEGVFVVKEIDSDLGITTRQEKKNRSRVLKELQNKGVILKYGDERGKFRKPFSEIERIDFMSTDDTPIQFAWPLKIDKLFVTFPKNIIVVAGEQDAGKTAFMLAVAEMNMDQHKINYFSSEMGAIELKNRLKMFNRPLEDWEKVSFFERSTNFADVIDPDGVNIIDFLEVHDAFYQVAGSLREIFDRLRGGIAIIGLQKGDDKEYGRGGTFSLEKPRLYLSIERDYPQNYCTIIKCKNWVDPEVNPNGLCKGFTISGGCRFMESGNWFRPERKQRRER